jgi:signal transduction histidine kinase
MSEYANKIDNNIEYKDNSFYLSESGKEIIKKNNIWFQMVDNSLNEIYSYNKPTNIPNQYSPMEFINSYKYNIANSTVFVYQKNVNGKKYCYFLGMSIDKVARYNIQYNPSSVKKLIRKFILIIILNLLFIISFSYFYFSKKMGKPLQKIINQIVIISEGSYNTTLEEKGIYKNIFKCLNQLAVSLKKSKFEKKLLDELREKWISSISHDMKTPLSSIKGFAEILKDKDYNFSEEEIKEYSLIIYEKSVYLEELISDLNFSYKLKNNCIPVNLETFNLTNFLHNIIKELLSNPRFISKKILFNYSSDNISINADAHLLKRAFLNLIVNFLIYNCNETNITLTILEEDNNIEVCIKDNGKGIPAEQLPYIFEQYYRGTNTTANSDGSGLGLAIANEIILLHNGKCKIDSELGKGTTLKVTFKKKTI